MKSLLLLALLTAEPWEEHLGPVSAADASAIERNAHAGADYSMAVITKNLLCRHGSASLCADATEKMQDAKEHADGVQGIAPLPMDNLCQAFAYQLVEKWEIDFRIKALLRQLAGTETGPERLTVLADRKKIADGHGVSIPAVKKCMAVKGSSFSALLDRASSHYGSDG